MQRARCATNMSSEGVLQRVVTANLSSGRDSAAYCLQCMSLVGAATGRSHDECLIQYHVNHTLISATEAVTKFRSSLDSNMDNINAYFYKLHVIKTDVNHFEDAHEQCKRHIRTSAKELIKRIQEHESRVLEELETHRDIEYKRTGLTDTKDRLTEIENNLVNLQQMCSNHMEETDNMAFLENVKLQREQTNRLLLDASSIDSVLENANELRPSAFSPIRCNTAFGTLEVLSSKRNQHRNSVTPRKNSFVEPMTLPIPIPQNGNMQSGHLSIRRNSSFNCSPVNTGRPRKLSLQMSSLGTAAPSLQVSPASPKLARWSPSSFDSYDEESEPLEMLWAVESEGPKMGEINCPSDVSFLPDGTLVVCDRGNHRLQLFDKAGDAVKVIAENKIKPCRVQTSKNGQIIVSNSKENNVCVYDKKGNCQSIVGKKLFKSVAPFKAPCGVASRTGKQFIVSDIDRNDVAIYNSDGKIIKELGKESGDCIEFKKPSYISTSQDGRIFVSDNLNHCVKVFNSQGKYIFQCILGSNKGSNSDLAKESNYLKYPNGVCCDSQGDIYVADWGSHTVSHFTRDGEFVRHVLTREDGIYHPAGIAICDDQLAVCSYSDSHSSVQVFKLVSS